MRGIHPALLCVLLLGACSKPAAEQNATEPEQPAANSAAAAAATFAGPGRDGLCLAGQRAAFVSFAASGDRNCTVRGTLVDNELVPEGDAACRIGVSREGDGLRLGPVTQACSYYCAAPASFAGKTFVRMAKPEPVADIAGDPLC